MTSNLGSDLLLEGVDDQGQIDPETQMQVKTLLRGHFKPEFLNRVDDIVLFSPLTKDNMKGIVNKFMAELIHRLADQDITLSVSEAVNQWLADEGYDPVYGARPLKRFITKQVETPLAKAIIAGEILPNTQVEIDLEDNQIVFNTL